MQDHQPSMQDHQLRPSTKPALETNHTLIKPASEKDHTLIKPAFEKDHTLNPKPYCALNKRNKRETDHT
jgi:hypothetical protein